MSIIMAAHIGRSWQGRSLEDACPCPKAPCGLVDATHELPPECDQHRGERTIRQMHEPDACPGPE